MLNGQYSSVATESPTSISDNELDLQFSLKSIESMDIKNEEQEHSLKKNWQEFQGRNYFCFDGRCMTSKQLGLFIFTVFLIVVNSTSFFIFDCPYIWTHLSPVFPIVDAFIYFLVLGTLFRTSFSDPGIIPRATLEEARDIEKQIEITNAKSGATSYRPPPRTKDIYVNGQLVKVKYCFTCKIFRPPRACHCSVCDNCVERFDHHCPWVGNCVGSRNYRYFYLFLVFLVIHCCIMFGCIVAHLILDSKIDGFMFSIKNSPASVIVLVVVFFSMWSVMGLACFHTYLIILNMTTNEEIKDSYSKKRTGSDLNPYRLDSAFANFCLIVCGPSPPSVLHLRKVINSNSDFELLPLNATKHNYSDENFDDYSDDNYKSNYKKATDSLVALKEGVCSNEWIKNTETNISSDVIVSIEHEK